MRPPNRIMLMGVSGAGKTTIGRLLADKLDGIFVDGDDLHFQVNVDKMRRGIALTDEDRWPWLERVAKVIREHNNSRPLIVACSALKRSYRQRLGEGHHLVYLKGSWNEIARRLEVRKTHRCDSHFMPVSLLKSQFMALEEPNNAVVLDLEQPPCEIARKIILALS